jgi:hypothetical protein
VDFPKYPTNSQSTVMNVKKVALLIAFAISTLASTAKISSAQQFEDASSPKPSLKTYVMVGRDANSNPYSGDTNTSETHSLLCIQPGNLPTPKQLPPPNTSPGGALVGSFSHSYLFAVPNIQGTQLTSRAAADKICNKFRPANAFVIKKFSIAKARMAEFHDGDKAAGMTGWKFWGVASGDLNGFKDRLWVSINDQNANPWGTYNQQGDGQPRKALTFTVLQQLELP